MDARNEMAMPSGAETPLGNRKGDHFVPRREICFYAVLEESYAIFSRNFVSCALVGVLFWVTWCLLEGFNQIGGIRYLSGIDVFLAAQGFAFFVMFGVFLFAFRMVLLGETRVSDLYACRWSVFCRGLPVAGLQLGLVHSLVWLSDWGGRKAGRLLEDRELEVPVTLALLAVSGLFLVWLGLRWLLCYSLIVGENCGVFASLTESARRMQGNKIKAFLLLLLVSFWGGCVTILTCGLGIILVPPVTVVLLTTIYAHASGFRSQRTADDQPPSFPTWGAEQ